MEYPGLELENFDKAHIWRKYIFFLIKKYLKDDFLEVGAGIGSFTKNYLNEFQNITLTELDNNNINHLKKNFANNKNIKILNSLTKNIDDKFNTIIHLNVLEHIQDDVSEINDAMEKLNDKGHLIILVPAGSKLYGKFDKAIGHLRRYEVDFFKNTKFKSAEIIDLYSLDSFGYLLYLVNQVLFKEEVYPSKFKIFIWDKIFTPITILIDYLLRYKFGKNIICILKKKALNFHDESGK